MLGETPPLQSHGEPCFFELPILRETSWVCSKISCQQQKRSLTLKLPTRMEPTKQKKPLRQHGTLLTF